MHADIAARQREGVDRAVPHAKQLEAGGEGALAIRTGHVLAARGLHQPVAERVEVIVEQGVRDVVGVAADIAHDPVAQPPLHVRRQRCRGGVAQIRQLQAAALHHRVIGPQSEFGFLTRPDTAVEIVIDLVAGVRPRLQRGRRRLRGWREPRGGRGQALRPGRRGHGQHEGGGHGTGK
ncbi:hypothetical protein D3C86_1539260 [compost metagenome]